MLPVASCLGKLLLSARPRHTLAELSGQFSVTMETQPEIGGPSSGQRQDKAQRLRLSRERDSEPAVGLRGCGLIYQQVQLFQWLRRSWFGALGQDHSRLLHRPDHNKLGSKKHFALIPRQPWLPTQTHTPIHRVFPVVHPVLAWAVLSC